MKHEFLCMQLYKVDCNASPEIVEKYANKGPKPFFIFFHQGVLKETVQRRDEWWEQSMHVRDALEKYDNVFGNIQDKDGKVYQLKDLDEFNIAMISAKEKVVAICYHNECPEAEAEWDLCKEQYTNLIFYKVDTIKAQDIKGKHADDTSKPYFKFYKFSLQIAEVKYSL